MKSLKRMVALCIVVLLTSAFILSATSCSGTAPELESVKERLIYLIEESKELNVIFFGKGLPVYKKESEISERKMVYFGNDNGIYERVTEDSDYHSPEAIKAAAEKIYSSDYVSEIYESAFDGIVIGDANAYVRFYDNGEMLCQNINATVFNLSERIYDYSTMEIIKPSRSDYINVKIDSYSVDDPTVRVVYLSFVYENGNWYLDSPSY